MQTTLVETESRMGASAVRSEADAFSNRPRFGALSPQRDAGFHPGNSFAAPEISNGDNRAVIEAMVNSEIYQEYEKAFSEATGMTVSLRPVEPRHMPRADRHYDTAVPVHLGNRLIGFLETRNEQAEADEMFSESGTISARQQESVVKLLGIFAQHLSLLSNQVVVPREKSEPSAITRAKAYMQEHQSEDLSLGQVAKAVNTSTFYFCKMFKKVTGINFTVYLSRVRIERARSLLLNPNLRVSEIAFEVGFQSLTHFNRVFKKLLGQSPTKYRAQLRMN
jgi:YesN/AraC family two-component response regulator